MAQWTVDLFYRLSDTTKFHMNTCWCYIQVFFKDGVDLKTTRKGVERPHFLPPSPAPHEYPDIILPLSFANESPSSF